MKEFFEKIFVGCKGYIQLWTPHGTPHHIAVTGDDWASEAAAVASRWSADGRDTYYRVTTVSAPPVRGRGGEDVSLCMPAVWADIDIAAGAHATGDLPPSVKEALAVAIDVAGEPSIVVRTGGGVHVYWLLSAPITIRSDADRAAARALVDGVQAAIRRAFAARGWRLDTTSDLARVLRVPGTKNYKYSPPRDVEVKLIADAAYDIDHLSTIAAVRLTADSSAPVVRPAVASHRRGDARIVLEKCNFIKHCRDDASVLPEPEWYAMITNLSNLENGRVVIHTLSAPYPRYSPIETETKIEHAIKANKPHTCEFIQQSLGFQGCPPGGCGVKAPVELGRRGVRGDEQTPPDDEGGTVPPAVAEARRRWLLPSGDGWRYAVDDDGRLVRMRVDKDTGEEEIEARIARLAIAVVEALHDAAGDGPVMYKLQFIKPGLLEIGETVVDAGVISTLSESDVRDLARRGAVINSNESRKLRQYFSDAIAAGVETKRYVSRGGWVSGQLLPYAGDVIVLPDSPLSAYVPNRETKDDDTIRSVIIASPLVATAASASVAATLLHFLGVRSFVVHFYGKSGSGKTAAARAAAAIWGDPDEIMQGWHSTQTALELKMQSLRNLPLFVDERQIVGEKNDFIATIAYLTGSEVGKTRASKTLALRKTVRWSTILISTGEEPLYEASSWTGARRRVLDVDVTASPVDVETTRAIYDIRTGGTLAVRISEIVTEDFARKVLTKVYDAELKKLRGLVEDHRAVQIAAILTGAAVLAEVVGDASIIERVRSLLVASAEVTTEADEDEAERGLKVIIDSVNANYKKFSEDTPAERWGWIDVTGDEAVVEIIESVLKSLLQNAKLSPTRVKRDLASLGIVETTTDGGKTRYRVYSPGRGHVVRLRVPAHAISVAARQNVWGGVS
ncbi:MAG: DUF927 domain-containing protein [Hydrogenibacillus schlegelii]|nr:DUF927 domain-containing protein [Hydrogenibacillus schlegelii]